MYSQPALKSMQHKIIHMKVQVYYSQAHSTLDFSLVLVASYMAKICQAAP